MGATGSVIQDWNLRKPDQDKWQCSVKDLRSVKVIEEQQFKELLNLCLLSWIRFDNVVRRIDGSVLASSSVPDLMQKQFGSNVTNCGSVALKNLFTNKLDSSTIITLTKFMLSLKTLDPDTMLHEMRKMGREYAGLGCTREIMYEIFELILSSISECFGALYSPDVENAWLLATKFVLVFVTLEQVQFKDDHRSVTLTPSTAGRKHGDYRFRIDDIDCLSDEGTHDNT